MKQVKNHGGSVEYECEWCKEHFMGPPSRGKAENICCSRECQSALKKSQGANCVCPICGKKFHIKPSQMTKSNCCSRECRAKLASELMKGERNHQYGLKGKDNPSWKADEKIGNYGYKLVRVLDHPFRNSSDFVFEHRLVAEKFLLNEYNSVEINGKRYLKPELEVHHIDGNKLNNNPNNLIILTKSEHIKLHNLLNPRKRNKNTGRFIKGECDTMLNLGIKCLTDTAKLPCKAHKTDACFDIYADIPNEKYTIGKEPDMNNISDIFFNIESLIESGEGMVIRPHETKMIHTGLACEIPHGYWMAIFARSGLASKQGLRPAQGVPVIDEPYRGEIMIPLHNDSEETRIIHHGDRICQFTLLPYFDTNLIEVDSLSDTDRGDGGFGSTGTK